MTHGLNCSGFAEFGIRCCRISRPNLIKSRKCECYERRPERCCGAVSDGSNGSIPVKHRMEPVDLTAFMKRDE